MRILHYTLGFPPYRSGGLTRYAKDLMISQNSLGHEVSTLYPSSSNILKKKCSVRFESNKDGIDVYEMLNPLPVPLYYGIKSPKEMIDESNLNEKSYMAMLEKVNPEVLHIHTLMGLPKRYLEIAHDKGIRIIYTSHDYFGLCPRVNLIDNQGGVCQICNEENCSNCNKLAKPIWFLKIRNLKCLVPLKSIARRIFK